MAKLTDSEQEAMESAWQKHFNDEPSLSFYDSLEAGFIAGLSYNQAKLDSERQERIAHNKQVSDKLDKLISFIKGEIPRSEIEDILQ